MQWIALKRKLYLSEDSFEVTVVEILQLRYYYLLYFLQQDKLNQFLLFT